MPFSNGQVSTTPVIEATHPESTPPLELIYTTSGSDLRFDLKGLGDAVRHIKDLFIEGWEKIRHRKADDFRQNTKAALEGLHALEKLSESKHLNSETKLRINHSVVASLLGLFEAGALPRDIQPIEIVSNEKLLSNAQQKLLPSPGKTTAERSKRTPKTKSAR